MAVATWSECCITWMTSHRPRTWHPLQSHYENDMGLTSLISSLWTRYLICHMSGVEQWLHSLAQGPPTFSCGVKYPFILLGGEKQFKLAVELVNLILYIVYLQHKISHKNMSNISFVFDNLLDFDYAFNSGEGTLKM